MLTAATCRVIRPQERVESLECRRLLDGSALVISSDQSARIISVATDARGNIFAVGQFAGTTTFGAAKQIRLMARTSQDAFIMRVSATDSSILVKRIASRNGTVNPEQVQVQSGRMVVIGEFSDRVDFDPGSGVTTRVTQGGFDSFILQLSASKLSFQSVATIGGTSTELISAADFDSLGNIWTAGSFSQTAVFGVGQTKSKSLTSAGGSDAFLAKWSPIGSLLYAGRIGGTGTDQMRSITIDSQDNVFAGGFFTKLVDSNPGSGTKNLRGGEGGAVNGMLISLEPSGKFRFSSAFVGQGYVSIDRIQLNTKRTISLLGSFSDDIDLDPGSKKKVLTSAGGFDAWFATLSPTGVFLSGASIGGTNDEFAQDLFVASNGDLYITGSFQGRLDIDPGKSITLLKSQGLTDGFVGVYSSTGVLKGGCRIGGSGTASVVAISRNKTAFILAVNFADQIDLLPKPIRGTSAAGDLLSSDGPPAGVLIAISPAKLTGP